MSLETAWWFCMTDEKAIERLMSLTAEDWGTATHILCYECTYGVPHEHDQHDDIAAHQHCGIAAHSHSQSQQVIRRT